MNTASPVQIRDDAVHISPNANALGNGTNSIILPPAICKSSSSSSSCWAARTNLLDRLLPPISIVHRSRQVFKATSYIDTELLYIGYSWSSCLCSSMWKGLLEYITYEFAPTSLAVSHMSGLSNLDSFNDGWYVAVLLLLCWVLPPGLVQYCSQHSCVAAVKIFLHVFS